MSESHNCHFCGDLVRDGYSLSTKERHYLSDCRPDLVEHEEGPLCTWYNLKQQDFKATKTREANGYSPLPFRYCYAYQNGDFEWGDQHIHFYPDGPT